MVPTDAEQDGDAGTRPGSSGPEQEEHPIRTDTWLGGEPKARNRPHLKRLEAKHSPRIFFPGPYIQQLSDREVINGIVYSDRGRLKKISRKSKDIEIGVWAAPTLFGVEDRYFVNALVDDRQGFVHRAYFRTDGVDRLTAVLEGPELKEKQSWHLSFYCGPKEAHAMGVVDQRLESTLEYGWLAPLAKGMMYLLNFICSYFFCHSQWSKIDCFWIFCNILHRKFNLIRRV